MALCPQCGHDNIPGVDACAECHQPLSVKKARSFVERSLLRDPIRALDPHLPVCVTPATTVAQVLTLLVNRRIGCVLVAENGHLLGIFTERDAVRRLGAEFKLHREEPISKFMTARPESLEIDDKIAFAVHRMDLGGYRHVPILDEGHISGVISVRDILRYIAEDRLELDR
jgi:CBS domain-containing protein